MKFLLLLLLQFFFFAFSYGQNWKILNDSVEYYFIKGEYQKGIVIGEKALVIAKKEFPGDESYYAYSLSNLGVLYERTSQYEKAEPVELKALEIRKKILGEADPLYAQTLSNLSMLYVNIGQYEKGERLNKQAFEIQKKLLDELHPDYLTSIVNLAFLYKTTGQYEKAAPLYFKALELKKKAVGENHADYALILNNIGVMYMDMGDYQKADSFSLLALQIREKTIGKNHLGYTNTLNNLAVISERLGQFEKAESLYLQTKELRKNIIGKTHQGYAQILNNLGIFYIRTGKTEKATPLILEATSIELQNLKRTFAILSEREKRNYLTNNIRQTEINNGLIYKNQSAASSLLVPAFNLQLFLKSLSLTETRSMLEIVNQTNDSTIQQLLKKWQDNKKVLARQYSLPQSKRTIRIDSLEMETEVFEKDLSRRSEVFKNQQKSDQISIADVRNNMDEKEVAIEFVRFRAVTQKKSDSVMYGAYILHKNDSVPFFIPLCEEKQLAPFFTTAGKTGSVLINSLYPGAKTKVNNGPQSGEELYKLIWQPLEPYLKEAKKVSYSPIGKLYNIAFHALPAAEVPLLMEKYQLNQYTGARQIALRNFNLQNSKPENIVLFGDPHFSMDSIEFTKQRINTAESYVSRSIYTPALRSAQKNFWPPLPGSAEEVKSIKKLFDANKIAGNVFSQYAASEENLKQLSGHSPQIIHIATHGFFLPEPDKGKKANSIDQANAYSLADDPLLRTGLILSGGNYAWSGKTPVDGTEDGIATAYEISQLNLSNTELVVLSACETALGDIKGSEGVFGLQRAFKMAGVKKMIVSLWKVPDKETAELMTTFYSYWIKGKTINDAFAQAQEDMRKKYAPFYWAAFVLIE